VATYWLETQYSVTSIQVEQIEILKQASAATFKFLMAEILPVMAHRFSSYTGFSFGPLQVKVQKPVSLLMA
jgi:hypothetical protein